MQEDLFDFNGDGKVDLSDDLDLFAMQEILPEQEREDGGASDPLSGGRRAPAAKPRPGRKIREYTHAFRTTAQGVSQPPPIPEKLTREEYRVIRRKVVGNCFGLLLLAAAMCFVPGAFAWAAIASRDPGNRMSGLVTAVFVIAGLVVIGFVVREIAKNLSVNCRALRRAKALCRRTAAARPTDGADGK